MLTRIEQNHRSPMPIPLTMAFINKGPVPKGVCTRCAGYGDIKTRGGIMGWRT